MTHESVTNSDTDSSNAPLASPGPCAGSEIDYSRFLDCVHCGLCTSACPTYLETGNENDSPRGRIYLMRSVVDGRLAMTPRVNRHLDLCLDCRACETACPSGVQYGRLIEPFRADLQQQASEQPNAESQGWFHRFFLHGLFPYASRMRWVLLPARFMQAMRLDRIIDALGLSRLMPQKLQRMHALLPKLPPRTPRLPHTLPAQGKRRARVALFTGCVADAMFGPTNWATARVLQSNGCDVVVPHNQVCCGAIHYHSGAAQPALEFANANASAFNLNDIDAVIANVAGCGSMLKDYGQIADELVGDTKVREQFNKFASKVRDVSEFLMELGPRQPSGAINLRAAYHDACHLAHAQQIRDQPRELLHMIPGLELLPLDESEICCGAAGSYNLTEPEMADRLGQRKVQNILATNPQALILGNAGCSLQIQAQLRAAGSNIWVAHPMDLLDLSYRQLKAPVGHS